MGMVRRALRVALTVIVLGGMLSACDRGEDPAGAAESPDPAPELPPLTALTFPAEVRAPHPEISAFVDEVLSTWLAGDYEGYRRFVSRAHTPESFERFEAIREVIETLTVESIELVETPLLPPPAYRVVLSADLSPEHQARRHEKHRKLAIVIFKEVGEWRIAVAPTEYQPEDEPPSATSSAPTTSAPSYPWDEEGDY